MTFYQGFRFWLSSGNHIYRRYPLNIPNTSCTITYLSSTTWIDITCFIGNGSLIESNSCKIRTRVTELFGSEASFLYKSVRRIDWYSPNPASPEMLTIAVEFPETDKFENVNPNCRMKK